MFETIIFLDKIFKLKHFLHIIFLLKNYDKKFDPQNEFQSLLKLNTFDLSFVLHQKQNTNAQKSNINKFIIVTFLTSELSFVLCMAQRRCQFSFQNIQHNRFTIYYFTRRSFFYYEVPLFSKLLCFSDRGKLTRDSKSQKLILQQARARNFLNLRIGLLPLPTLTLLL